MEKICPKSAAVYVTQMIIILVVVIAAIVNLSWKQDNNKEMWLSLLCSTIGYILPNPKLSKPSSRMTITNSTPEVREYEQ